MKAALTRSGMEPMSTSATSARQLLAKSQSLIALVLMVVAMSVLSDRFLSAENGWNILRQISVNLCLSIGMTLIILSVKGLVILAAVAIDKANRGQPDF